MAEGDQMLTLNRKLGGLKAKVTKLRNYLESFKPDKDKELELQNRLSACVKIKTDCDELRNEYYGLPEEADISTKENELEDIDDAQSDIEVRIRNLLLTFNKTEIKENSDELNAKNISLKVKLPVIPLPEFYGSYESWDLFKSKFNSLMEAGGDLTSQQKLHYLQASLKGEAKQVQTPNDTFESLYRALKERYENKRIIASTHIGGILSLSKLMNESSKDLRVLVDSVQKHLRSLELLDLKPDKLSQQMLINIVLQKLDRETRRQYEMTLKTTEFPDWEEFIAFLLKRCQILESLQTSSFNDGKTKPKIFQSKTKAFLAKSDTIMCAICKQPHSLFKCKNFNNMNVNDRYEFVKKHNLCLNCLFSGHRINSCKSPKNCSFCSKRHNSALCRRNADFQGRQIADSSEQQSVELGQSCALNVNSIPFEPNQKFDDTSVVSGNNQNEKEYFIGSGFLTKEKKQTTILSTVIVHCQNNKGVSFPVRAIIDSGSQCNLLTNEIILALGLKCKRTKTLISGISGSSNVVNNKVSTIISNKEGQFKKSMEFLVVSKITDFTPTNKLDMKGIKIPDFINLSDKNFHLPGKVHMLIGNQFFFEILKGDRIKLAKGNLVLQNTVFGYTASGVMQLAHGNKESFCGLITDLTELDNSIKRFWEIENFPDAEVHAMSEEERFCERHFLNTHRRDETGRYIVQMPLSKDPKCLGDSKQTALQRLNSLWRRLIQNPEILVLYKDFIQEYLEMGHMEEVVEQDEPFGGVYYLPHHGVHRPGNSTTPLRVVFNASSLSSTGESLNSLQLNGGVIQEELFSILLRFRKHRFAIMADIKKMFRMIQIDSSQRDLLRIVWKNGIEDPVKTYRLTTVTYGTTSAPYLATRSLKQLAIDDGNKYPLASEVLKRDVYMDDLLTGSNDLNIGKELQEQLVSLLQGAGMKLHKWSTNHPWLLPEMDNQDKDLSYSTLSEIKTLGLLWKPHVDSFSFKVSAKDTNSDNTVVTKKMVLSTIAKIFDPLGLLGPVITRAKIFMQTLWQIKLDWNDPLPSNLASEWKIFLAALSSINSLDIPRYCFLENSLQLELHAFSDSSEKAYGAVLYIRCVGLNGQTTVKLLCSKSKVAPLKSISIPRLELCGAVLLSKLLKKALESLRIDFHQIYLWTDSSIVLAWISKPLSQLKTFVRNRVSLIQELTKPDCWRYVNTKINPADLVSRGIDPSKIQTCDLWWHGPPFLHSKEIIPTKNVISVEKNDLYLREFKESSTDSVCALLQITDPLEIISNCSSFTKLQRVVAWCLRFIRNARNPLHQTTGSLTSSELSQSLAAIVKNVQGTCFTSEIQCLRAGAPLPNSSRLLNLSPFLDSNEIIRVGGRLRNSNLPIDQKHPMLIPAKHIFTFVLINYYHVLYFHTGAEATLAIIRMQFWIVSGRNVVRNILGKCLTCKKINAKGSQQMMADLPASRVIACGVFRQAGVDYCGPFRVKTFPGRCKQVRKCYVAIFVCFAVKAVHLEIVNDLTTEAFIGALKRFVSRRGRPFEIHSDNGTNFVGANNELRKILKSLFGGKGKQDLETYLANEGVKWHFNPPAAPHFGGLWEAGVKSLKYHLKRVVGNTILCHESFFTLIVQIEAVLNSRPLCPLSNDPNDNVALTPAHFLVGSSLLAIPDPDFVEIPVNRLSRWQLVQKLAQTFWKQWSTEYLNRLQQRPKWCKGKNEFKEGELVLVKPTENSGNLMWHLARITEVHPGKDKVVRVVSLKGKSGVFKRPVTKIAKLPYVN